VPSFLLDRSKFVKSYVKEATKVCLDVPESVHPLKAVKVPGDIPFDEEEFLRKHGLCGK